MSRTTFEQTTNGTNWTFLGEGIRITGGWQLGQGATANSIIRGRGYVASDVGKGSGQIVETIVGLPTIVAQPLSCTNSAGTVATFTANAIGSAPLSCQWFKGTTPLSDGGKTTGSATFALVLSNLLASDAGQYFIVITNTYGATTSSVANLAIIDPAILTQPTSQSVIFGGSVTFSVTASGTGMTYQWRRGEAPLMEATNAMLVLTNVSGALAGNYDVVICGSHGCVTSSVVSLTVTDPAIVSQPVSQTVLVGGNAAFTVGAVGTGIGYQWRRQGSLIAGATDASLSLTNVTAIAAGNYDVLVCGSYGCVTSSVASFTVLNPAIQPTSQSVGFGSNATFTVSVAGTGPISYQWRRQGTPLDGATNATLAMMNLSGAASGSYDVVVCGSYGCATSSVASLTVIDPAIVTHPVSQTAEAGNSVTFTVSAVGTGPITYQWRKQETPIANATNTTLTLANLSGTDVGSYGVVVCGSYGCITSSVAVLTVNFVDPSFNPEPNAQIYSLALQGDKKILVGGGVTTLCGKSINRIGRLNADGTLDTTFNPGASDSVVSMAVQLDGKILIGGCFATLSGQTRNYIGRLNADGTLDTAFNPGANGLVWPLVVQADGKMLVGGNFTTLGGQTRNRIGRLNPDGTVDSLFDPGANSTVYSLTLQADGKILVGGNFTTLGGQSRSKLGRLNADGTVDTTFNPGADNTVWCLAVQWDGKILVGGDFTTLGGQSGSRIGRLNADGTVDTTFNPGANYSVYSLALQADGKILTSGNFTQASHRKSDANTAFTGVWRRFQITVKIV